MGPSESWEIGGKGLGGGGQEMRRGGICALFFPCCAVVQRAKSCFMQNNLGVLHQWHQGLGEAALNDVTAAAAEQADAYRIVLSPALFSSFLFL